MEGNRCLEAREDDLVGGKRAAVRGLGGSVMEANTQWAGCRLSLECFAL